MAMYDDKKKNDPADAYKKKMAAYSAGGTGRREAAGSAIGGVVNDVVDWGVYGGNKPAGTPYAAPLPNYAAANPTNQPVMLIPPPQQQPVAAAPAPLAKAAPAVVQQPRVVQPVPAAAQAVVAPSQAMTPNQADARERAAASASPAVQVPTVGAPKVLPGGGASYFEGSDGVRKTINADGTVAGAAPGQNGVQQQSFGNTIVNPATAAYGPQGPNVASTFGMSVNDPRINNQAAPSQAGTFRGPEQMAEQYNNRESREMQTKILSDLDSERFRLEMIAGNPGRRGRAALDALGQNAQQRVGIANAAAGQAGEAIQNRNKNATQLENTGLEQSGANSRAVLDANNRLDVTRIGDATDREQIRAGLIDKPQYVTDADGNYLQVANGSTSAVKNADGSTVKMPQPANNQRDYAREDDSAMLIELIKLQVDPITGERKPDAVANARKDLAELRGTQNKAQNTQKPSLSDFMAQAKAANPGKTDAELRDYYAKTYGK